MKPAARRPAALVAALVALVCGTASAANLIVDVPSTLSFFVYDARVPTPASPSRVRISFDTPFLVSVERIQISVSADAPTFTRPAGQGTAIPASALSWTTHSPVNGVAFNGTLDSGAYTVFYYQTLADILAKSGRVDLDWTLDALPAGVSAGDHTLTVRYRFEALLL